MPLLLYDQDSDCGQTQAEKMKRLSGGLWDTSDLQLEGGVLYMVLRFLFGNCGIWEGCLPLYRITPIKPFYMGTLEAYKIVGFHMAFSNILSFNDSSTLPSPTPLPT